MQIFLSSIINLNYRFKLSFALGDELCSEVKFYHAYIQLKNIPIIDFFSEKIVISNFLRSSPHVCDSSLHKSLINIPHHVSAKIRTCKGKKSAWNHLLTIASAL